MIKFDSITGVLIAEYVEKNNSINILSTLNDLHQYSFNYDYKPFDRLNYYERLNNIIGVKLNQKYNDVKDVLLKYQEMLINRPKVFCHNDCQLSNFIGNVLIDFEFCGNNDFLYDYACFGNNDLSISKELIMMDNNIVNKAEAIKIVELWYSLQALSWYNVALFKDKIGFSKQQNLDFVKIALMFYDKAKNLLFDK